MIKDRVEPVLKVLSSKGQLQREQLVKHHAERPEIRALRIASVLNELGRKVEWRAVEGLQLNGLR